MQWRRRIGLGIIALITIGAVGYGFLPQPVSVEVAAAERGMLRVTIEEQGKTRVVDRFVIYAPVAGVASRIELKVGDQVEQGQTLLQLEPLRSRVLDPRSRAEAQARVAAARAALQVAQEEADAAAAGAELAEVELQRIGRLREINHATQDELDRAQAQARHAQATLRSAQFAVDVARHQLEATKTALQYSAARETGAAPERVVIASPIEGRVLRLYRESAGVVDAGQALIEVGDPRALEVEVDVLSADAVQIKPDMPVLIERWGNDEPLEAVVRIVEPVGFTKVSALGVEEQRVLVIAAITSPREVWIRLGDGYRVEASFILWEGQDVLQIPAAALFRYAGGWAVFVAANGRAQRRVVEIGQRNGLRAQVLSGLTDGEMVILHPDDQLDAGKRVRMR